MLNPNNTTQLTVIGSHLNQITTSSPNFTNLIPHQLGGLMTEDEGRHCCLWRGRWGGEQGVRWGNSVRRVSVMLAVSWRWLVSPPPGDDGIFTERVGRMEWDQRVARRPGSCPSHACAGPSVFLTCDVFGGAYERPNIFLTDFLSAAFSKLCIWFILSWLKRSFQCKAQACTVFKLGVRQRH